MTDIHASGDDVEIHEEVHTDGPSTVRVEFDDGHVVETYEVEYLDVPQFVADTLQRFRRETRRARTLLALPGEER